MRLEGFLDLTPSLGHFFFIQAYMLSSTFVAALTLGTRLFAQPFTHDLINWVFAEFNSI